MKIRLLVDVKGPNPAFKPPDPKVDMAAWLTYKHRVPFELVKPAGTEIDDPWAFIHCLPNTAGVIIAEPIDDDAKLMTEGEAKGLDPRNRRIYDMHVARRAAQKAQEERELAHKQAQAQKESNGTGDATDTPGGR